MSEALILIGSLLMAIAALGVWRFDDLYLKMHAATKAGTLGAGLTLIGVGLDLKNLHSLTDIIVLLFFIALTNPISAHLIAGVAYRQQRRSDSTNHD